MSTPPPFSTKDLQVLITTEQITGRISILANEIARTLPKNVLIVSILRGSFVFAADLIRALHATGCQPQVDFLTLASYGTDITSSGTVRIVRDLTESVEGRDVLIVDDILESGRTLTFAKNLLKERKAKSVRIAVLLEKPGKRVVPLDADFVGFVIENKFAVGYGLDYANYYRELPFIGALPEKT